MEKRYDYTTITNDLLENDNLVMERLEEAKALLNEMSPQNLPIRFEVSVEADKIIRNCTTELYRPPPPDTILGTYTSIPMVVMEELPGTAIVFIYADGRKELKVLRDY